MSDDDFTPEKATSIKYEPDEETLAKFEAWVSAPERMHIEDIVRRYSPFHCYRSSENPHAHYAVHAYNDDGTVRVIHGADSFLPGWEVFGYDPEILSVCDCKAFRFATEEETASVELASTMSQGFAEVVQ
jgi:hypothetical protein